MVVFRFLGQQVWDKDRSRPTPWISISFLLSEGLLHDGARNLLGVVRGTSYEGVEVILCVLLAQDRGHRPVKKVGSVRLWTRGPHTL